MLPQHPIKANKGNSMNFRYTSNQKIRKRTLANKKIGKNNPMHEATGCACGSMEGLYAERNIINATIALIPKRISPSNFPIYFIVISCWRQTNVSSPR